MKIYQSTVYISASIKAVSLYDHLFCPYIIGASSMLPEFKRAFAGEVINPNDLIMKEELGEGEYLLHN